MLLCALHEAGLRVLEDLAVFAFDGSPESEYTWPRLSTVARPVKDLGQTALEALLAPRLEAKPKPRSSPANSYCAHPVAATDTNKAFPTTFLGMEWPPPLLRAKGGGQREGDDQRLSARGHRV